MIRSAESAPMRTVRSFARNCLFWLGVAYLLILVTVMTPYTYQLDDIKVSILHTLGPLLTIAYLIFLALGWVAPPRRALLWTLGGYLGVVTLSTIFAPAHARWSAWDGWRMQWALLGPFLAFLGGGGGVRQVRRVGVFVMLLALYGVLVGVAHCGLPGRPGIAELMRNSYGLDKIEKDVSALYNDVQRSSDPEQQKALIASIRRTQQQVNEVRGTFAYKLVNTLASAKGTMMSFILNRDFFASFLLLTVPFALVVLLSPASPTRGAPLAWVLGIALGFVFIGDAATHYLAAMVPKRALLGTLAVAVDALCFVVVGRWRRTAWVWLAYAAGALALLGLAVAAGMTPRTHGAGVYTMGLSPSRPHVVDAISILLQVVFFVVLIPVAAGAFHLAATSVNQRIGGATAVALGLGCAAVGFYDGLLLAVLAAVVVLLALRAPALVWRILAVVTVLGGAYCLYRTDSKVSMYAALPVEILVVAIVMLFPARLHLGARWRIVALAVCAGLVVVTLAMAGPKGGKIVAQFDTQAMQEHKDGFLNPMIARQIMWTGGLRIWLEHPILGASPKSYLVYFPLFRRPDYFLYEISHVTLSSHNFFVDLLSETGILGFVTFIAFLAVLYAGIVRRAMAAQTREVRVMAACLLAAMTGFLLENIFDVNARWPIGAGPFWALLGVMAGFVNRPVRAVEVRGVVGAQGAEVHAAENDEENPAIEPVWSPSPVQKQVLWIVCGLCALGAVWTTAYSYHFFAGSMANNNGLSLLGEPSPAEANGPIFLEYERLQKTDRDLRNPALSAADRKKLTSTREISLGAYQEYRRQAIAYFQAAIEYNPHFVTSYYKLASVLSMGNGVGSPTEADFKAALDMYRTLQEYTPDFSQIRLNLGIINSRLADITRDKKYQRDALENFRLAVRQTINIGVQPRQSSETLLLCNALISDPQDLHRPWRLEPQDLPQPSELAGKLMNARDPVAVLFAQRLPDTLRQTLADLRKTAKTEGEQAALLAEGLNAALAGDCIYEEKAWKRVALSRRTLERLEAKPDAEEIGFLNRALLAQAFPDLVTWVPVDEAVEAAARLRHAWTDILVNKVPVRRSEAEVRESVRNSGQLEVGIARDAGWTNEAARTLRAVEAIGLDNEEWLTDVVAVFSGAHDDAGLAAFLEGYVERQPEIVEARLNLAVVLARLGRLRDAERHAAIVAGLDPTRGDVHYVLFDVARQAADRPAAVREAGLYLKTGKNSVWKRTIEEYLKLQQQP